MGHERAHATSLSVQRIGPLLEAQHAALLKAYRRPHEASHAHGVYQLHGESLTPVAFAMVTFYTEGPPHDQGLHLAPQAEAMRAVFEPHLDHRRARFFAFSLRDVRSMVLKDGTHCSVLARDLRERFTPASKHKAPPNAGYASIGYGSARPCFILYVLERMGRGSVLLYVDVNLQKHWNLAAFPDHAETTARWLLAHARAVRVHSYDGVVMPCENGALKLRHICSLRALKGARQRCKGKPLGHLPSLHSNRFVAEASGSAERALRAWIRVGLRLDELIPSEMHDQGRWHTP